MEEIELQSYTATNQLRWAYVPNEVTIGHITTTSNIKVLQQLWQGSKGHQKWEEIPTVNNA